MLAHLIRMYCCIKGVKDMKLIEIETLSNGSHRNLVCDLEVIPNGWAKIPDDMETPNFPFGEVRVKEVNGIMTVTKWTPDEIPEISEVETPISELEQLRADVDYIALMKGVDL